MSETNSANAGNSPANAGSENVTTENDNSNSGGAEGSAQRILEESKKWKARASIAEKELQDLKKKEAEKQGQYQKLYEEANARAESLAKDKVRSKVRSSVDELARKAGCVNIESLMKLGNPELLEFNEENEKVYGTDLFIEDAKKMHPYLFSSGVKTPTINPATPGGMVANKKLTAEEIVKLPPAEQKKYWLAAATKSSK